ncbi:MAG: hypothetical protein JWP11_3412 [Frankiales bacterium]|nr:hypothetical protein [Frankiales bacterium]
MSFLGDRRIATRFGLVDLEVRVASDGRAVAKVARPEEHPRLSAVTAAFGVDEDEAVVRMAEAIDRWGCDPPAEPRSAD